MGAVCCANCSVAGNLTVHHNHIHHVKTFQHGVSRHDSVAIWVAFFWRWQRYRCGQGCGLYYDSGGSGVRWTSNVVHDVVSHAINWNGFGPPFALRGHFTDQPISHSVLE
eukprot:COSAG04_NODE_1970_length_5110_cov_7.302734_9_plen_110_part_00